jgi:amino acid transporter
LDEKLPTASAFERATNSPLMVNIILITALVGLLTSWNGFFLAGSRVLFALGRGKIITPKFGKSHPKFQTPYYAVVFSGVITFIASLLGQGAMTAFVNVGSLCIVIAFFGVSFSFLSLRQKFPEMPRPFYAPGGKFIGYFAILCTSFMLLAMISPNSPAALAWPLEWGIFSVFTLLGLIFWWLSAKIRNNTSKKERDFLILEKYS